MIIAYQHTTPINLIQHFGLTTSNLFSHPISFTTYSYNLLTATLSRQVVGRGLASNDGLTIPKDMEQQAGRRKEELEYEAMGLKRFRNTPIVPTADAGTKENPILVPSGRDSRAVGFEDPVSHQLVWFMLHKGPLAYVPDIGLYFKLIPQHMVADDGDYFKFVRPGDKKAPAAAKHH